MEPTAPSPLSRSRAPRPWTVAVAVLAYPALSPPFSPDLLAAAPATPATTRRSRGGEQPLDGGSCSGSRGSSHDKAERAGPGEGRMDPAVTELEHHGPPRPHLPIFIPKPRLWRVEV
ncbi:hypothetical protein EJB05_45165, partial [Eragrostis curvula]